MKERQRETKAREEREPLKTARKGTAVWNEQVSTA
jgi:hypothetical protein